MRPCASSRVRKLSTRSSTNCFYLGGCVHSLTASRSSLGPPMARRACSSPGPGARSLLLLPTWSSLRQALLALLLRESHRPLRDLPQRLHLLALPRLRLALPALPPLLGSHRALRGLPQPLHLLALPRLRQALPAHLTSPAPSPPPLANLTRVPAHLRRSDGRRIKHKPFGRRCHHGRSIVRERHTIFAALGHREWQRCPCRWPREAR